MSFDTFSAWYFLVFLVIVAFMMFRLISGIDWKKSAPEKPNKGSDGATVSAGASNDSSITTDSGSSADG
jgi:hypothetical protein